MPILNDSAAVVRAYRAIRAKRAAIKKDYEAQDNDLKAKLVRLENAMLSHLNETNQKAANTDDGIFYKQEEITPAAADWDTIYKWIVENDAFEFLEKRIGKGAVKKYMEDNGGAVPPGMNVHREFVVRVRKNDE